MAQANINVRTDADLKRDFELLCQDIGLTVTAAFNVFMKQSVREKRLPVTLRGGPAYDKVTTTVPGRAITEEELLRRAARAEAGHRFEVTIEELEALEREGPDGPTLQRLEQRRKAVNGDAQDIV